MLQVICLCICLAGHGAVFAFGASLLSVDAIILLMLIRTNIQPKGKPATSIPHRLVHEAQESRSMEEAWKMPRQLQPYRIPDRTEER
jgi:hypothetical protein